jgi:ribonuclease HI
MRHQLRDADVWAKVDDKGALVTDRDGRVDIVYKPVSGAKVYRAGARNLVAASGAEIVELEPGERAAEKNAQAAPESTAAKDAIHVWTDGACTGNPGPAGAGVVIVDGRVKERIEISKFLGDGTNNIAELTAILLGLERVAHQDRSERVVIVYSDSAYSIGLLTQAWKAKANKELVEELRGVCRTFRDLRFVKVAGHSGVPLNERTDQLAREAIVRRR